MRGTASCYLQVCLLTTLLPLISCVSYPAFPKCDKEIIKNVHSFWNGAGTPKNVIQSINQTRGYAYVYTSYDVMNTNNECILLRSTVYPPSFLFTFLSKCKHSCCEALPLPYQVNESNGVISVVDGSVEWNTILVSHNVIVSYVCSPKQGVKAAPVGSILASLDSWNDPHTQETIRLARGIMEVFGFSFLYEYGIKCFNGN